MSEAWIRFPMTTGPGGHKIPARIALHGKSLGLRVTHETAGGWWQKDHLIYAEGTNDAVSRYADFLRQFETS